MGWFADMSDGLVLAQAADAAQPSGMTALLLNMVPFLIIAFLFYLLLIRPEKRKKDEQRTMLQNLKKNDRVVTIGGVYGTVVAFGRDAEEVVLKIDDNNNTKIRLQRSAISRVLTGESDAVTSGSL